MAFVRVIEAGIAVGKVTFVRVIEVGRAVCTVPFFHDCAFIPMFCSTLYIA